MRRRRFRRRGGSRYYARANLERRVFRTWNRPILTRFWARHETQIPGDQFHKHAVFNLTLFNNDNVRQQLYGYVETFDSFKVVRVDYTVHFKTSAEFTVKNAEVPEIYWAYDHDMGGRYVDIFNIMKMPNCRTRLLAPLSKLKLRLVPRWDVNRLGHGGTLGGAGNDPEAGVVDTWSQVPRVMNPWMDIRALVHNNGQSVDVDASNGIHLAVRNAANRTLVVFESVFVLFRGRRNNQSYTDSAQL